MSRERLELTDDLERAVVAFVRAGGYPQVAAEAAGLPREVFQRWLRRGQGPRARPRYRRFALAVRQAHAQARLGAEAAVLSGKPLDWLRYGPGRETAGSPGWTGAARPGGGREAGPVLLDPQVQELMRLVLQALEPFPDARQTLAGRLGV
jgi:hypothetical protein